MTLDDFIAHWTGKPVDFDGIYPNQCMDLMHQYIYDVLNLTDKTFLAAPYAKLVFQNFDTIAGKQYFTKIDNTPTNVPIKGDIIFWGQPAGQYKDAAGVIQYAGHVAVFVSGDVNNFTSFDTNWPEGSLPHLQTHTYDGVLGWLSPLPQQPQLTVAQVQDQLNKVNEALNQCTSQEAILSKQASDALNVKQALQVDFDKLQLQYADAEKEIVALTTEIASFTTDRRDYAAQNLKSTDEKAQLAEYLDTIAAHAGVDYKGQTDDKITSSVMLVLSQNAQKISDLQNQLKRYTDVKNAVSQTIGAIPSSTKQNIFKSFLSIFWTQS